MDHISTYWIRKDQGQRVLGLLECYFETLHRLDVLTERPQLEQCRLEGESPRVTFRLSWSTSEVEQALCHPRVSPIKHRLDRLCYRQRVVNGRPPSLATKV